MPHFSPVKTVLALSLALVALAACNRNTGGGAPRTWATQLAATYYETRGDGAAVARMDQASDVESVLNDLRTALGAERNARIGAERIGFILEYPPIWRADHLDHEQWDARRARIALLPDNDVGQWRAALATAAGAEPSEIWTIGYLIDTPTLFKENAFDSARSGVLLERLAKLSGEAIGLISATLHTDRAWAALLIVQNDEMFHGADIDPDKFAAAVAALGEITAPQPSGTKN